MIQKISAQRLIKSQTFSVYIVYTSWHSCLPGFLRTSQIYFVFLLLSWQTMSLLSYLKREAANASNNNVRRKNPIERSFQKIKFEEGEAKKLILGNVSKMCLFNMWTQPKNKHISKKSSNKKHSVEEQREKDWNATQLFILNFWKILNFYAFADCAASTNDVR